MKTKMQKIADVKYTWLEQGQGQDNPIFLQNPVQHIISTAVIKVMNTQIYKPLIGLITSLALLAILNGCGKSAILESIQQNAYEKQFEDNILNQNFRVQMATDNGVDLTAQYAGYTFRLLKTTSYNGLLTAEKNSVTYNGSWSCNDDYSKLVITLPSAPPEFIFLTREWKFTKKSLPIMELAPWGTTEPKVLHMERF
jgi:hypothetical protein